MVWTYTPPGFGLPVGWKNRANKLQDFHFKFGGFKLLSTTHVEKSGFHFTLITNNLHNANAELLDHSMLCTFRNYLPYFIYKAIDYLLDKTKVFLQ